MYWVTCTGAFTTSHCKYIGINMELVPLFQLYSYIASTLLGVSVKILAHSFRRASAYVGGEDLAYNLQFILKVSHGV